MLCMFLGENYLLEPELFEEARAYSEKTKLPLVEAIRNSDVSDEPNRYPG